MYSFRVYYTSPSLKNDKAFCYTDEFSETLKNRLKIEVYVKVSELSLLSQDNICLKAEGIY